MNVGSQRYLAFNYQQTDFKFTTLPFGLSTSPRVFSMVAATVVVELRKTESPLIFKENVRLTTHLLESLGWYINHTKSNLVPSQTVHVLGVVLDFETGMSSPSETRILGSPTGVIIADVECGPCSPPRKIQK